MELFFRSSFLDKCKERSFYKKILSAYENEEIPAWRSSVSVDSVFISVEDLQFIQQLLSLPENKEFVEDRRLRLKVNGLLKPKNEDTKYKKLEQIAEAFREFIRKLPSHYIFSSQTLLPYFVEDIKYESPRRDDNEPMVRISMVYLKRGTRETDSKTIFRSNIPKEGISIAELLNNLGFLPESEELLASYQEAMNKHIQVMKEDCKMFLYVGPGDEVAESREEERSRWSYLHIQDLGTEKSPLRVILDNRVLYGNNSIMISSKMYVSEKSELDEHDLFKIPTHPYVRVFDLLRHRFFEVLSTGMELYVYTPSLRDKLVLPSQTTEMLDILIESSKNPTEDIIRGKTGGVVILLSGPPGTGKTLSAEVYSEVSQKPLYLVQCSQLGISAEDLEEEFQKVLNRASRWGAILLLDEADVYVRERSSDINQNAIVGVFLRLLERYDGILFLTTNKEDQVDDAVMSRLIANFRYTLPDANDREKLWRVLSSQYGVNLSESFVKALRDTFKEISGRYIKQLLRLAVSYQRASKRELVLSDFVRMSKCLPEKLGGSITEPQE